jgi:hypothetical protein
MSVSMLMYSSVIPMVRRPPWYSDAAANTTVVPISRETSDRLTVMVVVTFGITAESLSYVGLGLTDGDALTLALGVGLGLADGLADTDVLGLALTLALGELDGVTPCRS